VSNAVFGSFQEMPSPYDAMNQAQQASPKVSVFLKSQVSKNMEEK
jgi:hypothetical protein